MNHLNDEQLILYHYGEAEGRQKTAEHLAACESCRVNYLALQRTLATVTMMPIPQRTDEYGAEVWRQLRTQLADRPVPAASSTGTPRRRATSPPHRALAVPA